jgi:hypothetical protein
VLKRRLLQQLNSTLAAVVVPDNGPRAENVLVIRHSLPAIIRLLLQISGPASIRFSVSPESLNHSVELRSILAKCFVPNPSKWKCLFIFAVSMSFDKDLTFSHVPMIAMGLVTR